MGTVSSIVFQVLIVSKESTSHNSYLVIGESSGPLLESQVPGAWELVILVKMVIAILKVIFKKKKDLLIYYV